jgi:hypothetical protein
MTTSEIELKALMLASLNGDAASYRSLLDRLSRRLRAYYKGKLAVGARSQRVQRSRCSCHLPPRRDVGGDEVSFQLRYRETLPLICLRQERPFLSGTERCSLSAQRSDSAISAHVF